MRRRDPDDWFAWLMLGTPGSVRVPSGERYPRSILAALRRGLVPASWMREALKVQADIERTYSPRPKPPLPARSAYNDPGWDNLIRAWEDVFAGDMDA